MKNALRDLINSPSLKIVFFYTIFSTIYIYSSDYFLEVLCTNIVILSKLQTYKGFAFIVITASLLFILVKRNIDTTKAYYQQVIDLKLESEIQLSHTRNDYMSLFNHSPLPMWIFDTKTYDFLLVNEAACTNYGYSQEEYKNMTLKDIRPPEDIPLMDEMFTLSLNDSHFSFPSYFRHIKKNGEIIQVKIKNSSVTFEGKNARLASAVDVTEELQIQFKLMESNSKLIKASELASLGYWTHDLLSSQIQWSDELYKIFELDPNTFELSLESIKARFHPDDNVNFDLTTKSINEENNIHESEHRIITGTGRTKWILERQYFTKNKDGRLIKIEGIALDITKRKLFEQELSESNERFKILTKATVEAIIEWDIKNDTVMWGEGFNTILGYDLSIDNNQLWSNNIHPDDKEQVMKDLVETLKDPTKTYFNANFRFLKANGEIAHIQHKGIFIRDSSGRATRALAAMIDSTETLEKIRKIELQNKVLKDIAWTQSHVVRAPLANLMGLVNLIKNKHHTGLNNEELLNHISISAEKLDTIIQDIVNKTSEIDQRKI